MTKCTAGRVSQGVGWGGGAVLLFHFVPHEDLTMIPCSLLHLPLLSMIFDFVPVFPIANMPCSLKPLADLKADLNCYCEAAM